MKNALVLALIGLVFVMWCAPVLAVAIPPHRAVEVPGIHAYTDWPSVSAGEVVKFRASASVPYRLQIARLGTRVDDPTSDTVLAEFSGAPKVQPIHPGSYMHVANGLAAGTTLKELTLECWVRPWRKDAWAGVITQYDHPTAGSYGLFMGPNGAIAFYLGDGGYYDKIRSDISAPDVVAPGSWYHLVATWNGREKVLKVNGNEVGRWPFAGPVQVNSAPLRIGSYGSNGSADNFLDADIALPVIYNRALSPAEVAVRFADQGQTAPRGSQVLVAWTFAEERGEVVVDVSGHNHHGRIINHAQWMVGGPSFRAERVPRFGAYKPSMDPTRGHAIRFSSDDLYDCGWEVTHEYRLPVTARPGMYVGRFAYEWEGKPCLYHVTFLVRAREKKPVLVLAATNTWLAYNNRPFAKPVSEVVHVNYDLVPFLGTPVYSFYRDHPGGQPAYYIGTKIPVPYADPYLLYSTPAVGYSHLARAERFWLTWLEQTGYEFDIASDMDLHQNLRLLDGYKVLVIQGHSEYWSEPMYRAVEGWLARGGNVVSLSGNTMYWRVSFDEDASVMECRKFGGTGGGAGGRPSAIMGEIWHEQDGERGGLMRECGLPAWKLLGLETSGWWTPTAESFGSFTVEFPDHTLFTTPNQVGLGRGASLGQAPNGGLPMAVGHEADVRLLTIRTATNSVPDGASLPTEPEGIIPLARSYKAGFQALDYFGNWAPSPEGVRSEIIYWERPAGGQVFNAGSIGMGWALSADRALQLLLQNVLHRFGVEPSPRTYSVADFNQDGAVDLSDFFLFAVAFGTTGKEIQYDLNGDGRVDLFDFFLFADEFGKNR